MKFGGEGRRTHYTDRGRNQRAWQLQFYGCADGQSAGSEYYGRFRRGSFAGAAAHCFGYRHVSCQEDFNQYHFFGFVQDDWKVSPRLTVNIGLRYELNGRFVEAQNRQSYFDRSFPGGRLLLAGSSKAFIPPENVL